VSLDYTKALPSCHVPRVGLRLVVSRSHSDAAAGKNQGPEADKGIQPAVGRDAAWTRYEMPSQRSLI